MLVGNIPGNPSLWREVKVYQVCDPGAGPHRAYAYVTTEAPGGGLQIIDLTESADERFAGEHADRVQHLAHAVHLERRLRHQRGAAGRQAYLFIAGANVAGGAFRIYDLADPVNPALVTPPPAGTGYMHDSTSMLITDNRTTQCANAHNPCEVLVDFNETSVDLWDVTDKAAPVRLSHHHVSDRDLRALGLAHARTTVSSSCTTSSTSCAAASTRTSTRSTSPTCARRTS